MSTSIRAVILAAALSAPALADGPLFIGLGNLDASCVPSGSFAGGISADGGAVVGRSFIFDNDLGLTECHGFRWTQKGGMVDLGLSPGTGLHASAASRCSADGSVIAGSSGFVVGEYEVRNAMYWTDADTDPVGVDILPGGYYSSDVTADGSMIVGALRIPNLPWPIMDSAFTYTKEGGIRKLGYLPGGSYTVASSVSADGSVVVGYGDLPEHYAAFRWTEGTGLVVLAGKPEDDPSEADGVSPDGKAIVGVIGQDAFRWTEGGGFERLGHPDGAGWSDGLDASADGSVIVGYTYFDDHQEAFIWDAAHRMRTVRDVLVSDYGLDLDGWTLTYATGISDDGMRIVGRGIDPAGQDEGWLAVLSTACYADFTGDGKLDLFDFLSYVNAFNGGGENADCTGDGKLDLFDFLCFVNAFNGGC